MDGTDILVGVYTWLPLGILFDCLLVGVLTLVGRRKLRARAAARWAVDAQPGDTASPATPGKD